MPASLVPAPVGETLRVIVFTRDPLAAAGLSSLLGAELGRVGGRVVADANEASVALWDTGHELEPDELSAWFAELAEPVEIGEPGVPTLAIVARESLAGAALAAGARGVVLRERMAKDGRLEPDLLIAALFAVSHGLVVLDSDIAGESLPAPARPRGGPVDELTARERDVVGLMAEGLSNKRIAAALDISEHTAKFHVNSVMSKLGATTRTQAVVEAVRRGLVVL